MISRLAFLLTGALAAASATLPDIRLIEAVKSADSVAVHTLLQKQVSPNAAQPDGSTALHWAAHLDNIAAAKALIGAGANPRASNRYGVTPLSLACTNGGAAMVELLLKAGADPNSTLPGGETVLMTAARTGRLEAVRALLARGANVQAKESRRGQTALIWAAAEGHAEVVEALIAAKADFRGRLDSGLTPLMLAVREGQTGAVLSLLKAGVDINEAVEPSPSAKRVPGGPRTGTTALMLAVGNAHFELASRLLDLGADPNAIGPGYTALHNVAWVRKPGVGDNDPAPQGSGRMTSLEIVRKLVAKGANVNARMTKKVNVGLTSLNTIGATPFVLAARGGDAELMRELAKLGADPLIPTEDNSTALIVAAGLGTRSPGEDAGTESEVMEAVQVALDLGVDINAVDNNGETAMHGAAYKNLPGVVLLLAQRGAKMEIWNRKNKFGWTPLRIAEGYRFGNFKPSPETVAAFQKVMKQAGN